MSFVGRVFKQKDDLDPRFFFVVLDEFVRYYYESVEPILCVAVLWSFGKIKVFPAKWIEQDGDIEIRG